MSNTNPESTSIVMYTTSWCSDCHRAKWFFDNYGIPYENIDIEAEPEAAAKVRALNGGNQVVPTILFADGSMLVEPSVQQMADKVGVSL